MELGQAKILSKSLEKPLFFLSKNSQHKYGGEHILYQQSTSANQGISLSKVE